MTAGAHPVLSALFLYIGTVRAQELPGFDEFAKNFGRSYPVSSPEYHQRRQIYENNAQKAASQNANPQKLWTAGTNELWDWDAPELSKLLGWNDAARPSQNSGGGRSQSIRKVDFLQKGQRNLTLPISKSWASLVTTTSIREQGACGSCWAIAAATTLQAATEIHGNFRTFSPQELVACVPNPQECGGQGGCRGATVELAFDWVMNHAVSQEAQTPYKGYDTACTNQASVTLANGQTSFGMLGWEMLPRNKYEPLLRAIAENGPTAVSADASQWHIYSSGIFDGCSPNAIISHAITAIGYGQTLQGTKYWHIQNSWGQSWGEGGYMRLLRRDNDENECGIDNQPELGSGCKGGPSQVTVCGMCGVLYDSVTVNMR